MQLPRYALSIVIRQVRLRLGRATPYEAVVPRLWLLVESSNIRGKLEALIATRFMTDAQPVINTDTRALIDRLYPSRNE